VPCEIRVAVRLEEPTNGCNSLKEEESFDLPAVLEFNNILQQHAS